MSPVAGRRCRVGEVRMAPGSRVSLDAEKAGRELENIRVTNGGELTPPDVLERARSANSRLHEHFEWDDSGGGRTAPPRPGRGTDPLNHGGRQPVERGARQSTSGPSSRSSAIRGGPTHRPCTRWATRNCGGRCWRRRGGNSSPFAKNTQGSKNWRECSRRSTRPSRKAETGQARQGLARRGVTWLGTARPGSVRPARHGLVSPGEAWCAGEARRGLA
jgi:hypothetical protein